MSSHDTLTHIMQTYQSREEPERLFALAGKYWRMMLSIEILIFCIAIAAGAYLLVMTFINFTPNKTQNAAVHCLNRVQLTQTIQGLSARAALFEQLKTGSGTIPDPSR
jgi:hypothetical protein